MMANVCAGRDRKQIKQLATISGQLKTTENDNYTTLNDKCYTQYEIIDRQLELKTVASSRRCTQCFNKSVKS